jgi:2-methylcitrate dehydratase
MSISQELAQYTRELTFEKLPAEVVHQTERLLLDTIGCAIGGYLSDASQIAQEVVKELDGPAEATIIGSGIRTSCMNAALADGVMVRFLDYNDVGWIRVAPPVKRHHHPSEVIPECVSLLIRLR